jgi:hypothetical protein
MERLRPMEPVPAALYPFHPQISVRSEPDELLQMFRVSGALHRDFRCRALDLAEIG